MRQQPLFWGGLLILVGILLLIGNVFDINVWGLLWPSLIILVGIWILWGVSRGRRPSDLETEQLTIPLEDASRARLKLSHGAGRVEVQAGAAAGELLNGSFAGGIEHTKRREEDLLAVRLRVPPQSFPYIFFPWSWGQAGYHWQINLTRQVPLELDLNTGAAEVHLDLSELQVNELRLQTGVSSNRITLPARAGHTRVRIEGGVGSVSIQVPDGVAAQIRAQGGLSSINVDRSRFPKTGSNTYCSPDYDTAEHRVEIRADTGLGSISIQ